MSVCFASRGKQQNEQDVTKDKQNPKKMPNDYTKEMIDEWRKHGADFTCDVEKTKKGKKVIYKYKGKYVNQSGGKHGTTTQKDGHSKDKAIGKVRKWAREAMDAE